MSNSRTQEDRILWLLQAAWPNWTPAPELAKLSLQYSARIFSLRRQGWQIVNRVRIVDGVRNGEFRLGSAPVRSGQKLPEPDLDAGVPTTLFDVSPERHRDDG